MGYWDHYPRYVTVAKKKAKAAKKLKQLKKKNPDIKPILVEGTLIAKTWWGKAWNSNLENYADYSNRIGRGRSYVRHGAVLDLQIDSGRIESLVQGTRSKPYSVSITIKPLNKNVWKKIKSACEGKLDSLQELLSGKFPKALSEIFTTQSKGLFPAPQEIDFDCSCPDWADMCKHVAATLYGVGARLDEDPGLFFKLRKVHMNDLISQAVEDRTHELLKKAAKKTSRVIAESDSKIADLFGLEMDAPAAPRRKKNKSYKKTSPEKKASIRANRKIKPESKTRKTGTKAAPKKTRTKTKPPFETVVGIVRRSWKGVTIADIREKTGFDAQEIRAYIYKAKRQGKIKSKSRGVYLSSNK